MNQTEKAAYTLTRQRIVDQIDNIVAQGGSDSTLKRLKRFGNAFSWYPEFYPQILEGIDGMSDKQLMSALRTEDSFMKLMAPVKGLPIHHRIANRTGGDLALRTPTDVFLDVRKMIYDKYGGFPGNSAWNLGAHGAIDERMHQGRYGAKGTVFEESRGLGMAPTEELPIAHGKGTRDIGLKLGQDPALIRSQADEIFQALDPFIAPQVAKFTEIAEHPTTIGQRKIITENIDPAAFDVGRTTEQSTAVRKAAEAAGFDVKFAEAFNYRGGGVRMSFLPFGGEEAVKAIVKNPVGAAMGAASFIEPEAVTAALQGDYEEAAKATVTGAATGAAIQQVFTKTPALDKVRAVSTLGRLPGAVSFANAAAKFAPPVLAGVAGYQMLDAIVEGTTGRNLQETGVAAEETKQQLREEGYSEYDLRRRARTGYKKP